MESMWKEKYNPIQLLQFNPFKNTTFATTQLLPQMPKEQLLLFLEQSIQKRTTIIVQLNSSNKKDQMREWTGVPRCHGDHKDLIILEDKNTFFLCPTHSLRHIRLA